MNSLNDLLFRLRWSLATFLSLAVVGIAVALVSQQFVRQAREGERVASRQFNEMQSKLSRVRDETEEIRSKIARYQELLGRGVVGQEERLDWVEKIANVKKARRLFDLEYELQPQKPADPALLPGSGGGLEFMTSPMKLEMQLLHEGDLLGFFADLRQSVRAIILVRSCDVERLPRNPAERGVQPQLKATCDLDWITLREKK